MADPDEDAPDAGAGAGAGDTELPLPADEDLIYPANGSNSNSNSNDNDNDNGENEDDDGEGVDFRFLASSSTTKSTRSSQPGPDSLTGQGQGQGQGQDQGQGGSSLLPKRGTKDFEPNATQSQRHTLSASRHAMYDALSTVRVHTAGRTYNCGRYVNWDRPEELEYWVRRINRPTSRTPGTSNTRTTSGDDLDLTEWRKRYCVVFRFKGAHTKTVGKADRRGWTWLLPEEALYLLERGSLDIRWPGDRHSAEDGNQEEENEGEEGEEEEEEEGAQEDGLPMSLQGAYASFIGKAGLTLERYLVYAGLKRSGYVVQRAPTWDDANSPMNGDVDHHEPHEPEHGHLLPAAAAAAAAAATTPPLIHRLLSWLINPRMGASNPCLGPLVAPGLYRNYNDIFRSLALIPYYSSSSSSSSSSAQPKPPFTISWLVYKPSTTYRKSAPPQPDYRICVVDARTTPSVPSMAQIGDLLDSMPDEDGGGSSSTPGSTPSSTGTGTGGNKRIETRIKQGRKSVLVAVVDLGVVSYLRFAEAEIGRYKLFEQQRGKRKDRGNNLKGARPRPRSRPRPNAKPDQNLKGGGGGGGDKSPRAVT